MAGDVSGGKPLLGDGAADLESQLSATADMTPTNGHVSHNEALETVKRRDLAVAIVLFGFVASVVGHYILGAYLEADYPHNTFLFKPEDGGSATNAPGAMGFGVHMFSDFFQAWQQTGQPSPYISDNIPFRSNYPPFAHLLLKPFSILEFRWAVSLYLGLLGMSLFMLVYRALPGHGVARIQAALVLALLTYPVLFLLDRANIDGFVVLFIWWAFLVRHERWWAASVLVGIAAAVKIYPSAFVLVFVQERRWREVAVTISTAALTTAVALTTFAGGPVKGIHDFLKGLTAFTGPAAGDNSHYVQHTASFISASKGLAHLGFLFNDSTPVVRRLNLLLVAVIVLALVVLPMRLWEKLFLICALTTVLLESTFDYRLSLFLIPLVALIVDNGAQGRRATQMLVLLAFIMIPKSEPVLYDEVTIGVILNPLLVLAGCLAIIGPAIRKDDLLLLGPREGWQQLATR